MSAISCSCRCAFRSIVSSARVDAGAIEPAHSQQPRPAEHRVERRPQLVRQRREEVLFRAIRCREVFRAPPEIVFEPLAFGDVADDQREAAQLVGRAAHRRDDHVRVEQRRRRGDAEALALDAGRVFGMTQMRDRACPAPGRRPG